MPTIFGSPPKSFGRSAHDSHSYASTLFGKFLAYFNIQFAFLKLGVDFDD